MRIHVEQRDDALQIPVQAILENAGQTFCLVKQGDSYATRRVVIASSNDKVVALDETRGDGLQPGDQTVLNPRQYRDRFDFSDFPAPDRATSVAAVRDAVDNSTTEKEQPPATAGIAVATESGVSANAADAPDATNAPKTTTEKGG